MNKPAKMIYVVTVVDLKLDDHEVYGVYDAPEKAVQAIEYGRMEQGDNYEFFIRQFKINSNKAIHF